MNPLEMCVHVMKLKILLLNGYEPRIFQYDTPTCSTEQKRAEQTHKRYGQIPQQN